MILTTFEQKWLEDVEGLIRQGSSLVVVGPRTGIPFDALQTLWDRLWTHPSTRDLAFTDSAAVVDEPPRQVVGRALRQKDPVDESKDLREGLRSRPLYCLVRVLPGTAQETPGLLGQWLCQWERYLTEFPDKQHPNSQLRVILVLGWPGEAAELRTAESNLSLLVPFEVPATYEDELATLGRHLVGAVDEFQNLPAAQRNYLWLRLLDLSGGSKPDLEKAIRLAIETYAGGTVPNWLELLAWHPNDPFVRDAGLAWRNWTVPPWRNLLYELIDRGGWVDGAIPENLEPLVRNLWASGLWVNGRGVHHAGWLTPAAIVALQSVIQAPASVLSIKLQYLSPVIDRVATDLLNRCLILERLLKRKLLELVETQSAEATLKAIMMAPNGRNERLWEIILRRLKSPAALTPKEAVWELSLGEFLLVREQMTGAPAAEYGAVVDTRNALAHGRPATWASFQSLVHVK